LAEFVRSNLKYGGKLMTKTISPPGSLRFKVDGLAYQSEVRALRAALGPLVGGEDALAFDTERGFMTIHTPNQVAAAEIEAAVAKTGLHAKLWQTSEVSPHMSDFVEVSGH
jgi:Cd2+/Zn2+-exporting ATPase